MAAVVEPERAVPRPSLPLLAQADLSRTLAWRDGVAITAAELLCDVFALAERLPDARHAVNLCERRYEFLVAFCAALLAGQTNLLPSSRAPQAIDEVLRAYPGSYAFGEATFEARPAGYFDIARAFVPGAQALFGNASIALDHIAAIGFTSGSTGQPKPNPKTWGSLCASSTLNLGAVADLIGAAPSILATVPPQHMYGLETSVLLPLRSGAAIAAAQPLFPADIARVLQQLPAPRVLVTTPFHLRSLLDSGVTMAPLAGVVSATAPLDPELAADVERRYATDVIELFGSTETCVIAHRRPTRDIAWSLYDGVELTPQPDGTLASAAHFAAPTLLQDVLELLPQRRFHLRGRNSDLIEIAGKRASLGDLTRRLLAIPGVRDAVMFQLDAKAGVARLAALVVAPALTEAAILAALRAAIDPAFLPRPLRRVDALPRNATGKLPRDALLAALTAGD